MSLGFPVRVNGQWRIPNALRLLLQSLGITTTPGLSLENTTPAAAGAQQYSPGLSQIGQGWSTNGAGASMPVETRWELRPVTGAAAPTFSYVLMGRVNNGAWTALLSTNETGAVTTGANLNSGANVAIPAANIIDWAARSRITSPANGLLNFLISDNSVGIRLQFAAAPTIASGFGTTPAIIAGSTDTAGGVNVGTGGVATSGVIAFATAWASAPFAVVMNTTTGLVQKAACSTTQMTITSGAWTAGDVLNWIVIGSK